MLIISIIYNLKCHVLTISELCKRENKSLAEKEKLHIRTPQAIFQLKYSLRTTYQRQFMKTTIKTIQLQRSKSN